MSGIDGKTINFGGMILNGEAPSGLITFFLIMASLVGILMTAKKFGVVGGEMVNKFMGDRFGKGNWFGTRKLIGRPATAMAESKYARSLASLVPGLATPLSKISSLTGIDEARKQRKAENEYISGVSAQKVGESDADYKKRKKEAKNRGLRNVGVDPKDGSIRTGPVNFIKKMLGGAAYRELQVAKAKEAKNGMKADSIKSGKKLAHWKGVANMTGANNLLLNPNTADESIDPAKIDSVVKLASDLEGGVKVTANNNILNVGGFVITANSEIGQAYTLASRNAASTDDKKEYRQRLKELESKAQSFVKMYQEELEPPK